MENVFNTLDESEREISNAYNEKYGVDSVSDQLARDSKYKVANELLGIDEDTLTVSLGNVSFRDDASMKRLLHSMSGIYLVVTHPINLEEGNTYDSYYNNMGAPALFQKDIKVTSMDFRDEGLGQTKEEIEGTGHRVTFISIDDIARYSPNSWETNGMLPYLNMKVSKMLGKYVKKFIPNILDSYSLAISATKAAELLITADPYHMITATENATFNSCFRFEGEFHYATHGMVRSPNMYLAVIFDDKGRIQYRRWVAVDDELDRVSLFKSYTHLTRSVIDEEATPIILDKFFPEGHGPAVLDAEFTYEGNVYLDPFESYVPLKVNPDAVPYDEREAIDLPMGYDIFTGEETVDGEVQGQMCDNCGDVIYYDEGYIFDSGEQVCDYCLRHNYTWSEYHDTYILDADAIELGDGEVLYESDVTFSDEFQHCEESGEIYRTVNMIETDDGYWIHEDVSYYDTDDGLVFYTYESYEEHATELAEELEEECA